MLSIAQSERNALAEKLSLTKDDLLRLQVEFDKVRRDAALHHEQDRQVIVALQDELKKFHIRFEDAALANDRDIKALTSDIEQLRQQKQLQSHENIELKTQLKLTEDNRDQLKRDLIDSNRRIREYEENLTVHRKEIQDLKRYLQDEQREKDLSLRSADDLRAKLKSVENEKIDLRQVLEEAKQRIVGKEPSVLSVAAGIAALFQCSTSKSRSVRRTRTTCATISVMSNARDWKRDVNCRNFADT